MATYSVAYLRFFKVLLRCFNFSMVSLLSPFSLSFLLRSLMFSEANSSSVTIPLKDSSSSSMTKSLLIDIVKVGLFLQLLLKVMLFFSLNCWTGWDNPGDKGWMFWRFSSTLVSKVNKLSWLRASNGLNNPKSKFSENCKRREKCMIFFYVKLIYKLRSGNGKIIFIYCSNWQKSSFVTVYWYCYWILPPIKENSFAKSMEMECTIRANKYQLCHFATNRKKSMPTRVLLTEWHDLIESGNVLLILLFQTRNL